MKRWFVRVVIRFPGHFEVQAETEAEAREAALEKAKRIYTKPVQPSAFDVEVIKITERA